MEDVQFHELMHVVRVNLPEDDGIPDFLIVNEKELPSQIYLRYSKPHLLDVFVPNRNNCKLSVILLTLNRTNYMYMCLIIAMMHSIHLMYLSEI